MTSTTREEALQLLEHFIKIRLANFGTYQDAMAQGDTLLFHSKLSFALNIKLISPLEVVKSCVNYWEKHQNSIGTAQMEGFVRQIIGWRIVGTKPYAGSANYIDKMSDYCQNCHYDKKLRYGHNA